LNQKSGDVPIAAERRNDIAAEIPAFSFKMLDRFALVTPNRLAALETVISPKYRLKTLPGWDGLNMVVIVLLFSDGVAVSSDRGYADW